VFEFIRSFMRRRGYAPSYEEIRAHFGFRSYNAVQGHLKQLETRGYLRSPWGNRKRAIEIVEPEEDVAAAAAIPLAGTVAAGRPIEAIEDDERIEVPRSLLRGGENFALRVKGDSMIEEGIHDGDVVIVRKQPKAERGAMVVALVDGEATVKRFHPRGPRVELRPAHPEMEPIVVPARSVRVAGVVIGLIRKYR
jgi:repressor LexA